MSTSTTPEARRANRLEAIKAHYASQTNTYNHAGHVIEQRPLGNTEEAAWEPLYNCGDKELGTVSYIDPFFGEDYSTLFFYSTGKRAAAEMADLKTWHPHKTFRIKRYTLPQDAAEIMEQANRWKAREQQRMEDGTYTPLPWANEAWFKERHDTLCHFAHVSTEDPGKIAFTADDRMGTEDRQQRMAPGRYLQQFFNVQLGNVPAKPTGSTNVYGDPVMMDALAWYARQFTMQYGTPDTLHFASTAEEMVEVYENGPDSCMSYDASHYEGDHHPVEVYAAGDLQLAYMKNSDGEITARALVWPEKKAVGRIYGDTMALQAMLTEQGYKTSDWNSLRGARLQIIPYGKAYIMPYIDGIQQYGKHPDGKHFQIGSSPRFTGNAHYTHGLDREEPNYECPHCGAEMDEDDGYMIITNNYGDTETWCEHCYENHTFVCEEDGETYSTDVRHIELANGGLVARCNAEDYAQCYMTSEWYHIDDLQPYGESGLYVSQEGIDDNDLVQDGLGNWWKPEDLTDDETTTTTTEEQAA